MPYAAPRTNGVPKGRVIIAGLEAKHLVMIAVAAVVAYWWYKRYQAQRAAAGVREGFKDNETASERSSCSKSLIGNYLTCDKYASDFLSRKKTPVERYQDQLQLKQEQERQKQQQQQQQQHNNPLVPDVKIPSIQDYVVPQSSTSGRWDKITGDMRGGVDVSYTGSLTQVSPAALDAAITASKVQRA
jgi:hypothetical protein